MSPADLAELDALTLQLGDANLRGFLVRVPGSRFYRVPSASQRRDEPSISEITKALNAARVIAHARETAAELATALLPPPIVIVDCLGRELEAKRYPDGSWNCPFCNSGVRSTEGECKNPACFTRPGFPPERAREIIAEQDRAAEEKRQRAETEKLRAAEAERERDKNRRIRSHRCVDCGSGADVEHANPNGRKVFLCRDCVHSEARLAGKFKFIGRNRTAEEAAIRIMEDKLYRGVKWNREGDQLIGRDGSFEIRLKVTT